MSILSKFIRLYFQWTGCAPFTHEVEGSTPTGDTCPNDFSDPIDLDIYTQCALSWKNNGIRVAVGDCSVTGRRRWRPRSQTGKTVHVHAKTLQKRRRRAHGAGCARPWFRTAEPLGGRRYENWITTLYSVSDVSNFLSPLSYLRLLEIDPRKRGIDVGAIPGWVGNDISIIAILL